MPRPVAPPRAVHTASAASLRITIPARRRWPALALVTAWLLAWAGSEALALARLVHQVGPPPPLHLAWLAAWTLMGAAGLAVAAWGVGGREVILVGRGQLVLRREVLSIGHSWSYDVREVQGLRLEPGRAVARPGRIGGPIAFEHQGRTVRFGSGVDLAEAADVLHAIQRRLAGGR